MCLVFSRKVGLYAMCKTVEISLISFICLSSLNRDSLTSFFNHISAHIARAIAPCSAFTLDPATTSCVVLFQDTKLPPIHTQYPEVERLYAREPAQLAFVQATT